jgi:uncharacterized protein
MKLSQEHGGGYRIRSYAQGRLRVNDEVLERSVVVAPDQLVTDWPPQTLAELDDQHLQPVLDLQPEVVILGTGTVQRFPDRAILQRVLAAGVGVEVMETGAACRTYNILMAEDRRVVAALLL